MSSFNFSLEVITPVHIGMGKEMDYIKGLDYIYQDGYYILFSQQKLLSSLQPNEANAVSDLLAMDNFSKFTDYLKKNNLVTNEMVVYEWPCVYETQDSNSEIKRLMQDGFGNWYIPGSSIKGSIRSVISTALYKSTEARNEIDLGALLGNIDNNIMRFVQVSDCQVTSKPGIFPVKIFSADPQTTGQWKHKRLGGHSSSFCEANGKVNLGFVSFYEMLTDGVNSERTTGTFRINWGAGSLIRQRRENDIPNFNSVFTNQGIHWLIETARHHTDRFLEKEILFFSTYTNEVITNESFLDELKRLKKENLEIKNGFILRVGANVGWHSITGDWKFDNYVEATENNRVGRLEKAFKTRKLIFDWQYLSEEEDAEGVRRFALPGFVKIVLKD